MGLGERIDGGIFCFKNKKFFLFFLFLILYI
jgi:hypothetical protein